MTIYETEDMKIKFNIPPRRDSIRLNLYLSEDTYQQLKIIQFKHEISMTQAVEMLMLAAIPEYFEQNPILDEEKEELLLESELAKSRRCANKNCQWKYSMHLTRNMLEYAGLWFCSVGCKEYFAEINKGKEGSTRFGKARCDRCSIFLSKDNINGALLDGEQVCMSCFTSEMNIRKRDINKTVRDDKLEKEFLSSIK